MRYPRPHPHAPELRRRLARLRERAECLEIHARLGAELRRWLIEEGSPAWTPSEDVHWRRWIERCGDDSARMLLAALDEALEERAGTVKAAEEPRSGSLKASDREDAS